MLYLQSEFRFEGPFIADEAASIKEQIDEDSHSINNFNTIKNFLEYFGSLVKSIAIDFKEINTEDTKQIVTNIPKTLNTLSLKHCNRDTLNSFGKLQDLETLRLEESKEANGIDEEHIFNFLKQNSQIKEFKLTAGELSKERFKTLPEVLTGLQSVDVACASKFVADDIVGFIQKRDSLHDIWLNIQIDEDDRKQLKERLPEKWKIESEAKAQDKVNIHLT